MLQGSAEAVDLPDQDCVKPPAASISHKAIESRPRLLAAGHSLICEFLNGIENGRFTSRFKAARTDARQKYDFYLMLHGECSMSFITPDKSPFRRRRQKPSSEILPVARRRPPAAPADYCTFAVTFMEKDVLPLVPVTWIV
jgi:hypothetical protein